MEQINKFNINDKVVFCGNIAIIKDYIIHAKDKKVDYLIQISDNKPELVMESDLKVYSNAIPEYIKQMIRFFNNVHKCDSLFWNGSEICLSYSAGTFRIPMDEPTTLTAFKDYNLEDLGI